ncbi:ABC transporter permease [Williamsia herbipolensis]|uniref:Transport permease protein n=1 Tax=Williamsia herbipolensis TaxID=1603258 RepID=A0AAU4JZK8_9NOCA|nr:ABC transporter permease [Williamsia herbipolensis]
MTAGHAAAQSTPTRASVGVGRQAVVHASALLRTWSRDPGIVVQAVVFPVFLLLMFHLVLGKTITSMGSGDSIVGTTGLVALVGALYGTVAAALTVIADRDSGVLARLWTLPVHRSGFLAGRLLAEAVRTAIGTVVLFAVAMTMGFGFDQGIAAAVGALAVPVVFGVGVAIPVIALATVAAGREVVQLLGGAFLFLLFFTTGFAPLTEYPGWIRPVVAHQPMSPAIDAIAGLTDGGPVAVPLATTLAWALGFAIVFGPLAMRGYRRAAAGPR